MKLPFFLLSLCLSLPSLDAAASTYAVSTVTFEPMYGPADDGSATSSRTSHVIIPLADGSSFVLWTQSSYHFYGGNHYAFIVRADREGRAVSGSMILGDGFPAVTMNETTALMTLSLRACSRFVGCFDFASLYVIDRRNGSISPAILSANNIRPTWNGDAFIVLARTGEHPGYNGPPTYFVATLSAHGELLAKDPHPAWNQQSNVLPAKSGYALITEGERTLHSLSGDILERTPFPGHVIDLEWTGNGSVAILSTGQERQIWRLDSESRPAVNLGTWRRDEAEAVALSGDADEVLAAFSAQGSAHVRRISGDTISSPISVPSPVVQRSGGRYLSTEVRREIPGDVGQVYVRAAETLSALDVSQPQLVSQRARPQEPVALVALGNDTLLAVWSEIVPRAGRVTVGGELLDGEGIVLPIVAATDAAGSERGVVVTGAADAVWMTADLKQMKRIALPDPAVPKNVVASDSGFLIYWTLDRGDGVKQILAARITASGDLADPVGFPVMPTGNNQHDPVIVWTGEQYLLLFAQRYSEPQEMVLTIPLTREGTPVGLPKVIASHLGLTYEGLAFTFRDGRGFAAWTTPLPRGAWIDAQGNRLGGTFEDAGVLLSGECCPRISLIIATPNRFLLLHLDKQYSIPRDPGPIAQSRRSDIVYDAVPIGASVFLFLKLDKNNLELGSTHRAYIQRESDRLRTVRR